MEHFDTIEIRPAIRRLLERLAKASARQGVTPSLGAVVATLAEREAARQEKGARDAD